MAAIDIPSDPALQERPKAKAQSAQPDPDRNLRIIAWEVIGAMAVAGLGWIVKRRLDRDGQA